MLSPITGKEMTIHKEWRTMTYKKETFRVCFHTWLCEDTGEKFEDEVFAKLNFDQVQHQYRAKYALPFQDEIVTIKENYELPSIKMSKILGFGDNTYRQYEAGEMPSQANARLIQLASDPHEFRKLVELSNELEKPALERLMRRIDHLIEKQKRDKQKKILTDYLFGSIQPDQYTGFKKPDIDKLAQMVLFFSEKLKPWKTKLNKLLFYADFLNFQQTGSSISGVNYRAIPLGPVPDKFQGIYDFLSNEGIVDIITTCFPNGGLGEQFVPAVGQAFNPACFRKNELTALSTVMERFMNLSTTEMIDFSHKEKAWLDNIDKRQLIDYFFAFDLN